MIITISREFGSGGRELGKRLADSLGIAYYDREIISMVAEKCNLNESYLEHMENSSAIKSYPITISRSFSYITPESTNAFILLAKQHNIIRELADKGDCVIVGRCADVILDEFNPLKIFVYANMSSKIARCRLRHDGKESLSDRDYERKIKQIDKIRAENYSLVVSAKWGDKQNYNLCINTTGVDIKSIVPAVSDYAKILFQYK